MTLAAVLTGLLATPAEPERAFVLGGATYGQIHARAAWLRDYFATPGQEEEFVCLASGDKATIAAALLAALGGGPRLLLPHALSPQVLAELRAASGFTTAITGPGQELPPGVRGVTPPARPEGGEYPPPLPPSPDRELLQLFTGGSSGAPQLWGKTGRNLFAEAGSHLQTFGISGADRFVATVPPYHIYGLLFSVIIPLLASAQVAAETPSFPHELRTAVTGAAATILVGIPAHYRALNGRGLTGHTLRLAFSSAGMLAEEDSLDFSARNRVEVVEVYGSTETGGIATRARARGESAFSPLGDIAWRLEGERLAVRSPYLSPALPRDEEGFALTGDRVRAEGNGFLLLGRAATVVKVGGKRVDLEEVRSKIKSLPGVEECLLFARPAPGGRENELAALVAGTTAAAALRRQLAPLLEPHALPRSFKIVARIPMSASGKYDHAALERMLTP